MLKKILSISGKPGLFKLVSQGRNSVIVESMVNARRMPVHASDRIVSLADISIYTQEEDMPLGDVMQKLHEYQQGKPVDAAALKDNEALRAFFGEVIPSFDRDRVYPSDIKKLFSWYNLLLENGFDSFATVAEEDKADEGETETAE